MKLSRLRTVAELFGHFLHRKRFFLAPLLLVLIAAAILLVLTTGLGHVAPFVYTLF